jgi:serine phosphatase RsbU (regulator of sigma subunit)
MKRDKQKALTVDEIVQHVLKDVQAYLEGKERSDDITCIAFKYLKE